MLLVAEHACSVAGVFTTNVVKAAPVLFTQRRVKTGRAQAVVINSGVANACTGEEGMRRCEQMAGGNRARGLACRGVGAGLLDRRHRAPVADGEDHRRHRPGGAGALAARAGMTRRWPS